MDAPPPSIAYARSGASPEPEPARLWAWVPWLLALPLVGIAGLELLHAFGRSFQPRVEVSLLVLQGYSVPAVIIALCLAILAAAVLLARGGPGRWARRSAALLIAVCLLGPLSTPVLIPDRITYSRYFQTSPNPRIGEPPQRQLTGTIDRLSPLSQQQLMALGAIAIAGHVAACLVIARALITSLGRRPHHLLIGWLAAVFFLHLAVQELHRVHLLQSWQAREWQNRKSEAAWPRGSLLPMFDHPRYLPSDRFNQFSVRSSSPVFTTLATFATIGSAAGVFWAVLVPFTFLAERTARTNRRFAEYHRPPTSTPAPPPPATLAPSPVPPTSPSIPPHLQPPPPPTPQPADPSDP